jgi:hypothetical protein
VVDEPDAPPDAPPFAYIDLAAGYDVSLFQDFSSAFVFDAMDWPEMTEFHDNAARYLFTLDTPFPKGLGVIAGRTIFVLDGASLETHDFGQHPRNTAGQADNLTGAVLVPNFSLAGTALVVSSGSEDTGDGLFAIDAQWAISTDLSVNNTRCVLYDATGAFDAQATAQRYLGGQGGVVRRSDQVVVAPGDIRSMRLIDEDLLVTRFLTATATEEPVRRVGTPHAATVLPRTRLRIVDVAPPASAIAWAIADETQLVLVRPDGTLDVIAELTDPAYRWASAHLPPDGHPLAGRIYVLESNRDRDLDRVLAITTP